MVKTKTKKPAAAKRGRGAVAKTTKKSSKEPASVTRCPYASAALCIAQGGGGGREIYEGEHPATSAPECGKLLQFKVPRKWLDLSVEDFEAYNFWFTLHLKSGGRVSTRLHVLNVEGELKELLPSGLEEFNRKKNSGETTAEHMEDEWSGGATKVRVAYRQSPRHSRRYQVKFLEASLQLGADGTVPESEFGPGPAAAHGEESDDEWMTLEAQLGRAKAEAQGQSNST